MDECFMEKWMEPRRGNSAVWMAGHEPWLQLITSKGEDDWQAIDILPPDEACRKDN